MQAMRKRTTKKPELVAIMTVRLSRADRRLIEEAANLDSRAASTWGRLAMLAAARAALAGK